MKRIKIPLGIGLLLTALIQAAVLGTMIFDRASVLKTGREIRLPVIPIDPRDLFRGDYVTLGYDISQLDTSKLDGDDTFLKNGRVYVVLNEDADGLWRAVSIHKAPLPAVKGRVVIAGRVEDVGETVSMVNGIERYVSVVYGIERYFVPEGEGREIEKLQNNDKVVILAAIAANGRAAIKGIIVDGKLRYEEPLF